MSQLGGEVHPNDALRVSVVIPALNEASTIAQVVHMVRKNHVHEVVVIDADSTDDTARNAKAAGATLLNWREVLPHLEPRPGKGESLWRGVAAVTGDVVVFIDADLVDIDPQIVDRLAAPFRNPTVQMVKAAYRRPLGADPDGGGRVTALCAQPLLQLLQPASTHITQPLGGEYAIRRDTAVQLPFAEGYGVEVGLLLEVLQRYGPDAVQEVDCGQRVHRNRPLSELGPMAQVVAATILHYSDTAAALTPQGYGVQFRPPVVEVC